MVYVFFNGINYVRSVELKRDIYLSINNLYSFYYYMCYYGYFFYWGSIFYLLIVRFYLEICNRILVLYFYYWKI